MYLTGKARRLFALVFSCIALLLLSFGWWAPPQYSLAAKSGMNTAESSLLSDEHKLFADSPEPGRDVIWPGVVRHRFVLINTSLLEQAERIQLNLFEDVSFVAVLDGKESLVEANGPGAGKGFIWRGHVENIEHGLVTFVVAPETVAANIFLPTGNDYIVRYAGDGTNAVHGVYDIDPSRLPPPDEDDTIGEYPNGTSGSVASGEAARPVLSPSTGTSTNDKRHELDANVGAAESAHKDLPAACPLTCPSLVGLLVVYTPNALNVAGSTQALLDMVNLGIDYANVAFSNSAIDVRLYLSNFRQVSYSEVDPGIDLGRLQNPSDGYMDIVHTWRDSVDYADLVTLVGCVPSVHGPCSSDSGVAYVYQPQLPDPSIMGFSWVSVMMVSGDLLAHEIGHNMGGGHAPWDGCFGTEPFACGHGNDAAQFHTIMAYGCPSGPCKVIQHFSNPNVHYCSGGSCWPTGVDISSPMAAYNALMFNKAGPFISAWR